MILDIIMFFQLLGLVISVFVFLFSTENSGSGLIAAGIFLMGLAHCCEKE